MKDKQATIEAASLGYPPKGDSAALATHLRKQTQRIRAKEIPGGFGMITEEDAERIRAARERRARRARSQTKGLSKNPNQEVSNV